MFSDERAERGSTRRDADLSEEIVMDGDTLLLCSDGLTRELSEAQIAEVLTDAKRAQEAANRLVMLATEAGGRDNMTVIVVCKAPKA
jgi:serine/threonine protein phosphatase PrpC